jgi:polyisoprenoid-binding protein YceI
MKISLIFFISVIACQAICQTRYIDRSGKASFFSSALVEDIEAHNNQAVSILDVKSGEIVASMLMKSFDFKRALMEEHFNENYVESNKFPKATFKGKITNLDQFNATKNGKYVLDIDGAITIHGVTKPLNVKGEAVVTDGKIKASAVFPIIVKDFKITIPRLVRNNIAEEVAVSVWFNYQPMNP